ncbi:pyrroline-5-carboxylate reductase [Metabacillus indicus]|uniref:pyrroline-5-carboxylate reductase n=1 Tax=Metabacillus indicus TaxID=246786 RepID=UPI002A086D7A|nr:pyrroline-5-carboxylate reductase [Metabacillus indicus]MDX8289401.1 pyrroline-5-carboxylate reductase [Metabacillus indicus]
MSLHKERKNALKKQTILFIGAGRMAESIISGLVKSPNIEDIYVSNHRNREKLMDLENKYGIRPSLSWSSDAEKADMILLAMPPEAHPEFLKELKPVLTGQFVVTIAAGIGPSFLEEHLGRDVPAAWIMPNTASEIGESMSLVAYGQAALEHHKLMLKDVLDAIGESEVCTEEQVHQLTAITGSAPAFLYAFAESLIEQAETYGISHEHAVKLVSQMMAGSSAMLKLKKAPKELREQVTTPGGATAEGINVLVQGGYSRLIKDAVIATNRKALGKWQENQ